MEISHKADYALRAVNHIAKARNARSTITEISEKQGVPRDFLAKILQDLTKAGILKSFKGVLGGYQLARPPAQITMLEVIEAVNGRLNFNLCQSNQKLADGTPTASALMFSFFDGLEIQVTKVLKEQTFAKFPARAK